MIVSNTSPLRYLIAVGQADLLSQVFKEVLIPPAVLEELTHPAAPAGVRQWLEQRPAWLILRKLHAEPAAELLAQLDRGECEALQLARETRATFVLLDERLGRRVAAAMGLTVIGALGLLRESYRRQLLADPVAVLDQMRRSGFRLSPKLYLAFQQEVGTLKPR